MRSFRFGFADRKANSLHARAIHRQRQQREVGLSEFRALVPNGKEKWRWERNGRRSADTANLIAREEPRTSKAEVRKRRDKPAGSRG